MLHVVLEQEKEKNYPTIRAILSRFYGEEFSEAQIEAVSGGLLSFGFMVTLSKGEEFFFKIEREESPLTPTLKSRQNAIYSFMEYMHDKHALNPNYPNSAKIKLTLNGEFSPALPAEVDNFSIPIDLINRQISLVTKLPGHDFMMKESVLNQKTPANPYNLTNYPKDVPFSMVNCIIDVQKAGEEFFGLYPAYLADLSGEDMRSIPRHFQEVLHDLNFVKELSLPLLQKTIHQTIQQLSYSLEKNPQLLDALTLENQQANIHYLQNLFAKLMLEKGYNEFNIETFGPSLRKAKISGVLDEKLTQTGNHIHQLTEAHTLCSWLSNGTFTSIYQIVLAFEKDYIQAYHLKKAKVVPHDAHVMNFIVNDQAKGKKITQIDMVGSLCSGQRIYDLCTNLRNACPPSNPEVVDPEIAKLMIEQYDNRERLSNQEIKSIFTLFKAVEIGNPLHGLAALLKRAAQINHLGEITYDKEITPQFPLENKKKVIDLDSQRVTKNNFMPLVNNSREKTCDALNLRTASTTLPTQIIVKSGLFAIPTKHQNRILATVETSINPKLF